MFVLFDKFKIVSMILNKSASGIECVSSFPAFLRSFRTSSVERFPGLIKVTPILYGLKVCIKEKTSPRSPNFEAVLFLE